MSEATTRQQWQGESEAVGQHTTIFASAHVAEGARIGADCTICAGASLESGAIIGDRVTLERCVQLWSGVELEDDVFVGPHAVFASDSLQPPRRPDGGSVRTIVRAGASIGANATIFAGIEIGRGAKIRAGAVVTESVPPHVVVAGNPARIQGYVGSAPSDTGTAAAPGGEPGRAPLPVRGVHVQRFAEFSDLRGRLTAGELPDEGVPFVPRRWFLVYDVPSRKIRGGHSHRACHQFLICVSGHVSIVVDDGTQRAEVLLDEPTVGLYIPPLIWASQFGYEDRSVLLVLASDPYDPADYVRQYDAFLKEAAKNEQTTTSGAGSSS